MLLLFIRCEFNFLSSAAEVPATAAATTVITAAQDAFKIIIAAPGYITISVNGAAALLIGVGIGVAGAIVISNYVGKGMFLCFGDT